MGSKSVSDNQFRLSSGGDEVTPVVIASGEIDLANVDQFSAVLSRATDGNPAVVVDLSAVTYCDSAALRELFSAAATTKLELVVPAKGSISTLLRISGLDKVASVRVVD